MSDQADFLAWAMQAGTVAKSSADGHGDALAGRSAPDEPSYQTPVRRLWPFGIRSLPPAGVEAIALFPNGSGIAGVMVGAESAKYGPSDLADGDVAIYCKTSGVLIQLTAADGSVLITDKKGGSIKVDGTGIVNLNNGTNHVARVGDATSGHAHAAGTLVAGPYTVTGVTASATDTIAENHGTVKSG